MVLADYQAYVGLSKKEVSEAYQDQDKWGAHVDFERRSDG